MESSPAVDRTSGPLALGSRRGRPSGRGHVKVQDGPVEVFAQHLGKRLFDLLSAPALRHERNAEAGLEHVIASPFTKSSQF